MKALQIHLAEVRAMGYNCPFVAKGVMTQKRPNEILEEVAVDHKNDRAHLGELDKGIFYEDQGQ